MGTPTTTDKPFPTIQRLWCRRIHTRTDLLSAATPVRKRQNQTADRDRNSFFLTRMSIGASLPFAGAIPLMGDPEEQAPGHGPSGREGLGVWTPSVHAHRCAPHRIPTWSTQPAFLRPPGPGCATKWLNATEPGGQGCGKVSVCVQHSKPGALSCLMVYPTQCFGRQMRPKDHSAKRLEDII